MCSSDLPHPDAKSELRHGLPEYQKRSAGKVATQIPQSARHAWRNHPSVPGTLLTRALGNVRLDAGCIGRQRIEALGQ